MNFSPMISKVIRGIKSPFNMTNVAPIRAMPNQSSTSSFYDNQSTNHGIYDTRLIIKPSSLISGTIRRALMNIRPLAKGKVK